MLLLSLLTDLPLVAIATDSVDSTVLSRPAQSNARQLLSVSLVLGSLTAAAELLFYLTVRHQPSTVAETSLYLFLSLTQLVVIYSVRNRDHFWRASLMSWPVLAAMTATGALTLLIPYTPGVDRLFAFTGPTLAEIGRLVLWSAVYLIVLDLVKVWYFKLVGRRQDRQRSPVLATS